MVTKEKDEELALFLEMRRREKDRGALPFGGSISGGLTASFPHQTRRTAADKFLYSENEKSEYDWLITPPATPSVPSLEMDSQRSLMNHITFGARPTALQLRMTNIQEEPPSKANLASKHTSLPAKIIPASAVNRRPSSSGEPASKARSRPATPTGRPTLAATSKASRPSTPISRATLPSTKPIAPVRSSTPTRAIQRSSTPTARPSLPATKAMSRSATPTRQKSSPAAAAPGRSASVSKSAPVATRNPSPSRGTSPTVKSRPWKPSEMPGFSLDAPPNLRTTLPERPASASRGRPGGTNARSSNDTGPNGRPRQQSCSPSRGRSTNAGGLGSSKFPMSIKSKPQMKIWDDDANPVLMGTQMVERMVNLRKLVAPKQAKDQSVNSSDRPGFGRSMSKKSLDMSLRHMDIRSAVSGNLSPLMVNIPASSMYSVRSGGSANGWTTSSASDSPLATRSNASSELSVNNSSFFMDGLEMEDGYGGSERGYSSLTSHDSKRFME